MKSEKRIVVVGSVGSTEKVLEKTARDCAEYCDADDADFFTFRRATGSREEQLRRSVRGVRSVMTHSAGFVALSSVLEASRPPKSVVAASAPVESSRLGLVVKVLARTARDAIEQTATSSDDSDIDRRRRELLKEYVRGSGPVNTYCNIGGGRLGRIAKFNSLERGGQMQREMQMPIGFIYPDKDELFRPSPVDVIVAEENDGLYIKWIEGRHDDFLVAPQRVLGRAAIAAFLERLD